RPGPRVLGDGRAMTSLDLRSRAATRGWSDLSIRNLFIIPTIVFLIVFNIFPLIYSLGFSFTDYAANRSVPWGFIGLKNYRDLLSYDRIWSNLVITAKYGTGSVSGP